MHRQSVDQAGSRNTCRKARSLFNFLAFGRSHIVQPFKPCNSLTEM